MKRETYTIAVRRKFLGVPYWKRFTVFTHWVEASSIDNGNLIPIRPRLCFETIHGDTYSLLMDVEPYKLEGYVEVQHFRAIRDEAERQRETIEDENELRLAQQAREGT